ncbi:MAG: T9SS type A sorting domain-containing protein [Ignavibacteria bacterium]|nr:T9SS type A sorting domain-containing protein [Ignavibacteria bacterium]
MIDSELSAGNYEVEFDASNFASGVYFYRLTAGAFSETKRMMVVK